LTVADEFYHKSVKKGVVSDPELICTNSLEIKFCEDVLAICLKETETGYDLEPLVEEEEEKSLNDTETSNSETPSEEPLINVHKIEFEIEGSCIGDL